MVNFPVVNDSQEDYIASSRWLHRDTKLTPSSPVWKNSHGLDGLHTIHQPLYSCYQNTGLNELRGDKKVRQKADMHRTYS